MFACCCRVLVVNGGCGRSCRSFCSTLVTTNGAFFNSAMTASMVASLVSLGSPPSHLASSARKVFLGGAGMPDFFSAGFLPGPSASPSNVAVSVSSTSDSSPAGSFGFGVASVLDLAKSLANLPSHLIPLPVGASSAVSFQYSSVTNAAISCSRSTMIFVATDCTRPALRPWATFLPSRLLSGNPTTRSMARRASWLCTRRMSMWSMSARACWMAFLVISLKRMRQVRSGSSFSWSAMCQAMASPSRSGSLASSTRLAPAAASASSLRMSCWLRNFFFALPLDLLPASTR